VPIFWLPGMMARARKPTINPNTRNRIRLMMSSWHVLYADDEPHRRKS
jgi:hypothetical protein